MTEEKYNEIMEARREYQREYHKRWAHNNPDKVKEINARFYLKSKEKREAAKAAEKRQAAEEKQKGDSKK